jgi:hypothetical protein
MNLVGNKSQNFRNKYKSDSVISFTFGYEAQNNKFRDIQR